MMSDADAMASDADTKMCYATGTYHCRDARYEAYTKVRHKIGNGCILAQECGCDWASESEAHLRSRRLKELGPDLNKPFCKLNISW